MQAKPIRTSYGRPPVRITLPHSAVAYTSSGNQTLIGAGMWEVVRYDRHTAEVRSNPLGVLWSLPMTTQLEDLIRVAREGWAVAWEELEDLIRQGETQ